MDRERWRRPCYDVLYSVQTEKTKCNNTWKNERDSSYYTMLKESREEHNGEGEKSNLSENE